MLKLYTNMNCPKCQILKRIMKNKNLNFEEVTDYEKLEELNIRSLPVIETSDGEFLQFESAMEYIARR